ncbi:PAS domain S-box-containing protein [Cytobacillus firmus]|uniref:HTH-type transcriptional regulatory protein TyrR n=2 Tax=Cytobacillus TaxID=2675230 RepID=A0A366JRZ5_CYTFI|nr:MULTISPECIES: sigma 54-interacting transcriptional regulator [Cytobacillus]RBP90576.1 PAS domain S-box-containing protein [Cytobacillus firmus]TDX46158.1 PAS domain S-box-containing protein [Cytobacillus oceanisediminis]
MEICELTHYKNLNHELETIINTCFDEIFVTDGIGTVLRVNPAGEAFYGMKAAEIVGKNTEELARKGLFSPSLFPIVKERKERVSMIQRTRTGQTIHCIGNPSLDPEGNIEFIIFTSRDLTEIRQLRNKIERTEHLLESFQEELEELRKFQNKEEEEFISFSPDMRKIVKMVDKIAKVDSTVLVTGKSGVGKGVIVSLIHKKSKRRKQSFIHVNCGAIPEPLIESELFGYEPGAFTGANKEGKKGLFEEANGGTLFLDEIGEMPVNLQVKLLKAIQEHEIQRVGGTRPIQVDTRIIAATNKDLEKMVEEGTFREDLFYRLNVIPIYIPPLKTRKEDISYLMDYFLEISNKKYGTSAYLTLEAENKLINYSWPGNVRELENLMERLVVIADKDEIQLTDLPQKIVNSSIGQQQYAVQINEICSLKQAQEELEEQLIINAYKKYHSSYKIGKVLGINQSTAYRKIQKYIKEQ